MIKHPNVNLAADDTELRAVSLFLKDMSEPGPVRGTFTVCRENRVTLMLQSEDKRRQCIIRG